jgi:hypothetical protein
MTHILGAEHRWECPNCVVTDVTNEPVPHTRFHTCAGLKGLTAPMVLEGTKATCQVRAKVREDYVGKENVTYDSDGTPIMAVETVHLDGHTDLAVMASVLDVQGKAGK